MKDILARVIECERTIRRAEAEQLRLIAELATDEWAPVEIGMALQLSPVNAAYRVAWATRLATVFPDVLDAMAAGTLTDRGAHALIDPTDHYTDELAQRVVTKTLQTAAGRTPQQLRRSSHARVQRADPAEHARRRAQRLADRTVTVYDTGDSIATLSTSQPVEIAHAMYTKIDHIAHAEPRQGRTLDQIRADVLAGLVLEEPKSAGLKPLIQVTVPITALLGVDERPGQLDTGQLIPAGVVRDLMSHPGTVFHRLLTDPAGHLLEYTPDVYRPNAALDRFVRARHRACVMPCCTHPARSCDLDHATPWPLGPTTPANLAPLDRRHHRYKHATNAQITLADDGTTTLTTRWGHTYATTPEPLDEPPF
ncbi:DUF222 domain-containing protein [Kutzneria sp. NPDC051319]|uniref:HNH endonuclease signature motif containing protein n=1 Tax=Kutzneria sp. NPDC051319 TaxID=3155047 RepID=UPI003429D23F